MSPEPSSRVPCPECGQEFSTRGLPAHRRQRHGSGVRAPLPAPVPESMVQEILTALQLLRGAVERIDEHLRVVEAAVPLKESPAEEVLRLERELGVLLEEIACVQRLASTAGGDVSPSPHADELARLRKEQARLVFRIDELRKGSPNEERFLS